MTTGDDASDAMPDDAADAAAAGDADPDGRPGPRVYRPALWRALFLSVITLGLLLIAISVLYPPANG